MPVPEERKPRKSVEMAENSGYVNVVDTTGAVFFALFSFILFTFLMRSESRNRRLTAELASLRRRPHVRIITRRSR